MKNLPVVAVLSLLGACSAAPGPSIDEALRKQRAEILKEVSQLLDQKLAALQSGMPEDGPGNPGFGGGPGGRKPGFLGIRPTEVDGGILLEDLMPDGPAEKGGLRKEDIITAVNGKKVTKLQELAESLVAVGENGKARFSVLRESKASEIEVILGERPQMEGPPMGESEEDDE